MMRVDDLMIGDWIIAPNGKPCKVVSTEGVDACVLDENKSIVPLCGEVIGVSLTAEILEKNGFKKEGRLGYIYNDGIHPEYQVYVEIFLRNNGEVRAISILNHMESYANETLPYGLFVHELQLKLRACELFDLANNFKV